MNNKLCDSCAKGDPSSLAYYQNYAIVSSLRILLSFVHHYDV